MSKFGSNKEADWKEADEVVASEKKMIEMEIFDKN